MSDIWNTVQEVGIWSGYLDTDWLVGWEHNLSGRQQTDRRFRAKDKAVAYAYYRHLCGGKDYDYQSPFIERADGTKWVQS
jgi:hypothetical protein